MIIKASNFLYLFDFDGTLVGNDLWNGFFKSCKVSFQQRHIDPSDFDIRWCILTSRPRIDRWLVKMVCRYHHLTPKQIIMGPTFTWKFKNNQQESSYKEQVIKDILDGKINIVFTDDKIEKVCYIDNNLNIIKHLNSNRQGYQYIAISVSDFLTRNFEVII